MIWENSIFFALYVFHSLQDYVKRNAEKCQYIRSATSLSENVHIFPRGTNHITSEDVHFSNGGTLSEYEPFFSLKASDTSNETSKEIMQKKCAES